MADDYSINAKISADSSGFQKGIKSAQSSLSSFSSGIASVTKSLMGLFAIQNFGSFVKSIGNIATSFDDARSQIVKGTGATGKALEDLSNSVSNAMRMGVGRSAEEIGTMIADLYTRFGVTGQELENLVDEFDMFASVTGQDTKVAIESVADVMLKWNIETEQADELLDQLTVASQASGASIDELENGLKRGQTTFKQFGMSVTKSTAFLASLKKNGIDSGTALVGLRVALVNFTKDGRNAETAFKEVTEQIKNASTESEALNIAIDTFGSRMGAELVKVFREGGESVDEMTKALMGAKGALKESDEASRTTKDAIEDLKAVFTSLFAGMNGTGLRDMIDSVSESLKSLNVESIKNVVGNVASELKTLALNIGTIIKTIFDNFRELFSRIAEMLNLSSLTFADWKESVYETLDNLYRIVQDAFGLIFAILDGDWALAWEYAKLIVLRAVNQIAKNLDEMVKTFKDKIEQILDFADTASTFLPAQVKAPLKLALTSIRKMTSKTEEGKKAIENAISATEKNIEKMTGKSADVQIKALDNVGKKRAKYVRDFETGEIDIQSAVTDTADTLEDESERLTDWDKNLLKQKLDDLDEWSEEYLETQIKIIEAERKTELEKEHSADEILKIEKYYNREVEKAHEESEKVKRKHVAETVKVITENVKSIADNTVKVFKKVIGTIKNLFNSVKNIFLKLFDLNPDEVLNNVLKVEDSILTFFVETLPKLPNLVSSIMQSIFVLTGNIRNIVNANDIKKIILSILNSVTEVLPSIVKNLLGIAKEIFEGIIRGLGSWIKSGGWKVILDLLLEIQQTLEKIVVDNIEEIADIIAEMLPDLVDMLVKSIVSASKTLGKIIKPILRIVGTLIEAILKVITSQEVINASIDAIGKIVEAIVSFIIGNLIPILTRIINAMVQATPRLLPKLIDAIINGLANGLGDGLVNFFENMDWNDVFKTMASALEDIARKFIAMLTGGLSEVGIGLSEAISKGSSNGYGKHSTGSTAGDVIVDILTLGVRHLFADGTNTAPSGLAIVGEAGPELVRFRGGEQVLNNRNTNKALAGMGGTTVNQSITFNNLQDTTAFAMMNQLKQYNRQMSINGII